MSKNKSESESENESIEKEFNCFITSSFSLARGKYTISVELMLRLYFLISNLLY